MASKLKQLREAAGKTQLEIATQVNLSVSGYCLIENGLRSIPSDKAEELAELFSVPVGQIFLPLNYAVCEN